LEDEKIYGKTAAECRCEKTKMKKFMPKAKSRRPEAKMAVGSKH